MNQTFRITSECWLEAACLDTKSLKTKSACTTAQPPFDQKTFIATCAYVPHGDKLQTRLLVALLANLAVASFNSGLADCNEPIATQYSCTAGSCSCHNVADDTPSSTR